MLIIDCHAHVYAPDTQRYPIRHPSPLVPPPGVGAAEHLRATSLAAGVSAVRAIQTVTYHGYDNRYLCDAAKDNPGWMSGVVCLDPDDPTSAATLRAAVRDYGVRSLRSIPSASRRTFDDENVRALWRIAVEEGISVDLFLLQLDLVDGARQVLREFPSLTVAFDHCMDPWNGDLAAKLRAVLEMAEFPNLYAKVDFVDHSTQPYPGTDMHEPLLAIVGEYGAERCIWGNNYPKEVWTPGVSYADGIRVFTEILPLTDAERTLILGENARRLWFPRLDS